MLFALSRLVMRAVIKELPYRSVKNINKKQKGKDVVV